MGELSAHLAVSRYAARILQARPALANELDAEGAHPFARGEIDAALEALGGADEALAQRILRLLRQRVLLRVMARDLAGLASLDEVCATMSDLAEATIAAAQSFAEAMMRKRHGVVRDASGKAQHLIVVGMGKLGGRELNVSSDIDLVFVYPSEGESDGDDGEGNTGLKPVSAHEYFATLGRKLIALLNEATGDGFVFRVDMRLRPDGESGALAISLEGLEAYFVSHGREWERYAWIKARALTGECHAELEAIRLPFVFRKYLDYATLAAMRKLHAEVRREVERRDLADHIKLGPGGIREIEFVAQALQLVRGGRDPQLTGRPTLAILARLADLPPLPPEAAAELAQAYVFLRNLEHRLQYLDDAQTHRLPKEDDDRASVAAMCGFASWEAFAARLDAVREGVSTQFSTVFAQAPEATSSFDAVWQDNAGEVARALRETGFHEPEATAARLVATRTSQRYHALPTDSRQRFDALVPRLAAASVETPDPDATLARGLDLIEAIARRAAYLALLAENREALVRVARMIGAASWAAEFITRHPLLLDELLDDRMLYAKPDWEAFSKALAAQLEVAAGDTERQMNALREAHQSQVFQLLAQDLAGILSIEALADHLSLLADILLQRTLELCWTQLRGRHADTPPRFAIVAYGKLGGKELGYASDLDIIFLYDDPDPAAPEVYARLAQRLNNWLTSRTSAGQLFDTDLRLRPSGASGLLVSSIEGFTRYQQDDAWVWEHQALTRARYCAGDAAVGEAFESVRERVLRRRRDADTLAGEVLAMRAKMHAAHPNASGLFDVKHDRGGMIDIEFIVQFLVLAHAHRHKRLVGNLGNIALLGICAELGLVGAEHAGAVGGAYREFRKMQHALRLNGAKYARVAPGAAAGHAAAVIALWEEVFGNAPAAESAGTGGL
ncbi:MAG: bifunctional [glutamate--ammonia ligase]-adenylyl-L-tyrosine phosphorylase/[glutamate--ammonia-ligase] adenylyltransferase [Betaproteobacteria bacterium]